MYALAIHGGAGTIDRDKMSPDMEVAYREGLATALKAGEDILKNGGKNAHLNLVTSVGS